MTMVTNDDAISLINLKEGAAVELFDVEMARCLENIMDPNTGDKAREINLKVKLAPAKKNPGIVGIEISCTSKLGSNKSIETAASIGMGPKGPEAREFVQQSLFETPANVRSINEAKGGES